MTPDEQVFALFRDEACERLDHMVATFLALERGAAPADAIEQLFRDAHTVKGGASMLGLDGVGELAHELEDVLESARAADGLDVSQVDPLLRTVDRIRSEIESIEAAPVLFAEPEPVAEPVATQSQAVRVSHEKIDRLLDIVGESILHHRRLEHLTPAEIDVVDELGRGERLLEELKGTAIAMRTLPLGSITAALPRAVRDIALAEGKEAELLVVGGEIEFDRVILETLAEPLAHLLRNAVAHGIETPAERTRAQKPARGSVELRAVQRGAFVEVVVADDGRGVDPALRAEAAAAGMSLADLLARPGFSTAAEADGLAGRGVGLDAVKAHVEGFGGSLEVRSEPGRGTEIVLLLPLALALLEVILVERGDSLFGLPLASVEEATEARDLVVLQGRPSLVLRGATIPLADLADVVGAGAPALPPTPTAVVVNAGGTRRALACDRLVGTEEVVVKSLRPLLDGVPGYLGASIRGDGSIALLLDPAMVVRADAVARAHTPAPEMTADEPTTVLVVEDSFTVRELQRSILEAAGYRVDTAEDGAVALERLRSRADISLVLTDLEMPNVNGVELTRAIRGDARHASLPVVMVTSLESDEQRQAGLDAGADAYIVKRSFDQRGLLETIERLVG